MNRRPRRISLFILSAMLAGGLSCVQKPKSDYAVTAAPLTAVKFIDGFWAKRQQTDIAVTIRHEMMEAEKTNRIKNFEIAAAALKGATGGIEGFGPAYDLPNPTGYAETCATIAYALWNYRMFLYYGDGKYMDLFERAAYNAFLSGYGMSGDLFFYPNPLSSHGQHARTPWFTCACCPPNVARFIAELGGFAYGVEGDKIFVNIYNQGTAELETKARKVNLEQTTDYPWTGDKWAPVKSVGPYGLEKDKYNTLRFAPVGTTGLRLEIQLPDQFSAGIHEWKVK